MLATSLIFDQQTLAVLRELDPVVQSYRAFFALLNWTPFLSAEPSGRQRGEHGHPKTAYMKALLVKLCEGKDSIPKLRTFLLQHPLLVLELGFVPKPDPSAPYGFDIEATVPKERWWRQKPQHLDHRRLQALFHHTVVDLQAEIPGLGETVAFDVTPIYAWVKQNNLRDYVTERFNPALQPSGDPDCRIARQRQHQPATEAGLLQGAASRRDDPAQVQAGEGVRRERHPGPRRQERTQRIPLGLWQWYRCRYHPRLWRCRAGRGHSDL